MERREPERRDRRESDRPVECPKCGALFKNPEKLGTHQFETHGEERREQQQQTNPNPPTPKPKREEPPKPNGDSPKPKPRGWFGGRQS